MSLKSIAIIAHDNYKDDVVDWARKNQPVLKQFHLYCTGTTGGRIAKAPRCPHDCDVSADEVDARARRVSPRSSSPARHTHTRTHAHVSWLTLDPRHLLEEGVVQEGPQGGVCLRMEAERSEFSC